MFTDSGRVGFGCGYVSWVRRWPVIDCFCCYSDLLSRPAPCSAIVPLVHSTTLLTVVGCAASRASMRHDMPDWVLSHVPPHDLRTGCAALAVRQDSGQSRAGTSGCSPAGASWHGPALRQRRRGTGTLLAGRGPSVMSWPAAIGRAERTSSSRDLGPSLAGQGHGGINRGRGSRENESHRLVASGVQSRPGQIDTLLWSTVG